ncbi:MAG: ATP synthase F1 subunit gamma [Bdellovibrio sp.]|nr:MAG: ATP synthase F1 subunit gamma [Bdellovibrio sp.]
MASLKDIRQRIASVKNTQQITRAMKMVSAAKLRRAQDNILNLRPYAERILSVIADIAVTRRVSHPLLRREENPQNILLVVINSDRGLCGGFNNAIHKFTEKFHEENKDKYQRMDYIFVGRRGAEYFKKRDVNIIDSILNLSKEISYEFCAGIAKKIMNSYEEGIYDEVRFIYNAFKSAISQELTTENILPVDISKSELAKEESSHLFSKDLIFEPAPHQIVDELLHKHFAVQVYRCMSESVAAEHAARMTAMENATNNAKEMIDSMTLIYNKLRQASITTELSEITSGAEALKG